MQLPERALPDVEALTGLQHRALLQSQVPGRAMAILVHGRTGTMDVMWTFSRSFRNTIPIALSPQGYIQDELGGYSWWSVRTSDLKLSAQPAIEGDQFEQAISRLRDFIDVAVTHYGADSSKLFGFGFSQGAALLSAVSLRYPGLFRGVALLGGFIPREVMTPEFQKLAHPLSGRQSDYFVAHGSKDETIPLERAERGVQFLTDLGLCVELFVDEVGHKVGIRSLKELERWTAERV